MEQFVLGIFQEHLSKFIVGFRKEQVNANLLNGKGEITDVALNCDFLNATLKTITPYIQLESVHVSKLSFHVSAWANLRKAPILVDIQDVTAVLVEPLSSYVDKQKRRGLRQLTQAELNDLIRQAVFKPRTSSYNLFDRIFDNISVEIRSVHVTFQPRGKFKTERVGEWTPPTILATLKHIRYVSVDEYGNEASPEDVWKHNKHPHGQPQHLRTFTIFKKLAMQCSLGLCKADEQDNVPPPLVRDAQVEIQLCLKKRLRDAAILAVQVDATLNRVEVHVDSSAVPLVAHAVAGVQYCLSKDRAFEDPLVPESHDATNSSVELPLAPEVVEPTVESLEQVEDEEGGESGDDEEGPSGSTLEDNASDISSINDDEADMSIESDSMHSGKSVTKPSFKGGNRPILFLPSGIVIHEGLTVTLSVDHLAVRGTYPEILDGHVQLTMKGLIGEIMWPKSSGEKGGYAQASLSYICIQERHRSRVRSVLLGGIQHDLHWNPLEKPGKPVTERVSDENFPLFEDRCIRNDPMGLRHSFPVQAFGVKSTISYIDKISDPDEQEIMVLHEVGVDQFEVLLDSDAWCRALRFAMNEDGGGFDPRWHSGDWEKLLTPEMLVDPTRPLDLHVCVQPTKEILLDENYMISSDLLNITAKITNVELRVPAAVQKDVRSCDIVVHLNEAMVVVSSALPRTFLSGKIGASIRGDESKKDVQIDFPNDPSDICYSLEETEDPSIRQEGMMTSRVVSTFRAQLTLHGFSVRVIPAIPFCNAAQPQHLLEPTEMTMIGCFEGEPPSVPGSNLTKVVLFLSVQFHLLGINFDFDVVTGAISTILYHTSTAKETLRRLTLLQQRKLQDCKNDTVREDNQPNMVPRRSVARRRVLVRKQIQRSRETGGLSVALCMQVAELELHLWRQNVSRLSRFRASLSGSELHEIDDTPVPLLKIMLFQTKGVEAGMEYFACAESRRIVLKGCMSEMVLEVCDFEKQCREARLVDKVEGSDETNVVEHADQSSREESSRSASVSSSMVKILAFGPSIHEMPNGEGDSLTNDILFRVEELHESSRTVALSADVGVPGIVDIRLRELESALFLVVEALLMPSGLKDHPEGRIGKGENTIVFPRRSVGAVLVSSLPAVIVDLEVGTVEVIHALDEISKEEEMGKIDKIMLSLLDRLLPGTDDFLFRGRVLRALLFLPSSSDPAISKRFALFLRDSLVLSRYLQDARACPGSVLATLAGRGTHWNSLFGEPKQGFQHSLKSRQSLHSTTAGATNNELTGNLVPTFDVVGEYDSTAITFGMGDHPFALTDLDLMRKLFQTATDVLHRSLAIESKLRTIMSSLRYRAQTDEESEAPASTFVEAEPLPGVDMNGSLPPLMDHITAGRRSFAKLRNYLEGNDSELRQTLRNQNADFEVLRYQVFSKERDRLAALALVSSQYSGFLRMGGTHMFGQRVHKTTTFWQYFAIVHKSLLLLYASPGDPKVVDAVTLEGSSLHPLAGGSRKRDVSRGFSLIERSGKVRFFLALSNKDYERWIRELQKSIGLLSSSDNHVEFPSANNVAGPNDAHPRPRSLSSGSHSASFDLSGHGTPRRRQQIRQRVSAITSSTKNKLGSAVQAARHIAKDGTDYSEQGTNLTDAEPAAGTNDNVDAHRDLSVGESDPMALQQTADDGMPQGKRAKLGQRFAAMKSGTKNRLGSAVHAAKEKGKVLNDQRKKRREQHASEVEHSNVHGATHAHELPTVSIPEDSEDVRSPDWLDAAPGDMGTLGTAEDTQEWVDEHSDDLGDSTPGRGLQLRQRVSKIGSAVKSVRQASQARSQRIQDERSNQIGGETIKLKSVRVGAGHPSDGFSDESTPSLLDAPWRRVRGFWVAQVLPETLEIVDTGQLAGELSDRGTDDTFPLTDIEGFEQGPTTDEPDAKMDVKIRLERAFRIRLIDNHKSPNAEDASASVPVNDVLRSFADVLELHSLVSEAVGRAMFDLAEQSTADHDSSEFTDEKRSLLSNRLGLLPLETLECTGRKLGGLFEAQVQDDGVVMEYQCETIMEFLNSIIDCPLPEDAHRSVVQFLAIQQSNENEDPVIPGVLLEEHREPWRYPDNKNNLPTHSEFSKTVEALATACEAELLRAELCGLEYQAAKVPETSPGLPVSPKEVPIPAEPSLHPYLEPLLPPKVTDHLHDAMHQALMNVMVERDEAHAQLIAANVLHVHEIQQERKKVERLARQLQEAQREAQRNANQPGFFGNPVVPKPSQETERMKEYHEQMVQSTEQELISLCQQLAAEISAKTSKSLEIIRLKESREIERENERREREALVEELSRCKELLAVAERTNALQGTGSS